MTEALSKHAKAWLDAIPTDVQSFTINDLAGIRKMDRGGCWRAVNMLEKLGKIRKVTASSGHDSAEYEVVKHEVALTDAADEIADAPNAFDHPVVAALEAKLQATNVYYQTMLKAVATKTDDSALRAYLSQICEYAP